MTEQEVLDNCVANGICQPGLEFIKGKDADTIWSSTDRFGVNCIYWIAVKNAGRPGWSTLEECISVLNRALLTCFKYVGLFVDTLKADFQYVKDNPTQDNALIIFLNIPMHISFNDPADIEPYYREIAPIVGGRLKHE